MKVKQQQQEQKQEIADKIKTVKNPEIKQELEQKLKQMDKIVTK